MLRSVPPDRAPAVAGCAENQKLPKINARVIRGQAGVGRIAMRPGNRHRVLVILLSFKWKIRIILGLPWIGGVLLSDTPSYFPPSVYFTDAYAMSRRSA